MSVSVPPVDTADHAVPGQPAAPRRGLASRLGLDRLSGIYVWALFILIYALWIPHTFLTIATVQSVAGEQAITGG